MLHSFLLSGIWLLAQTTVPPGSGTPYVFELKDPKETLYAYITDRDLDRYEQGRVSKVSLFADEPWNGYPPRSVSAGRIVNHRLEDRMLRPDRIAQGWEANGGVQVEIEDGFVWVDQNEAQLSERARKLAAAWEEAVPEPRPTEATPPQPPESIPIATRDAQTFWELWGTHLAVIGISAALIALVVWTLFVQ